MILFFLLPGCWKEDLSKCWKGDVVVSVYAEKFQVSNNDIEDVLSKRVKALHYFLYRDGVLVENKIVNDFKDIQSSGYPLKWNKLPFGNYKLLVVANAEDNQAIGGDINDPGKVKIIYPGADRTSDLFTSAYDFTLDCDCGFVGETVLKRIQGVIQYEFKNVPKNITEVEVTVDQLGTECGVDTLTIYNTPFSLTYRTPIDPSSTDGTCSFAIGMLPTLPDCVSTLKLKLYSDHDPDYVVYESLITDTARVERNQLLKVTSTFPEEGILGNISFGVIVNPKWDGSNNGDVEVQ